MPSGDGYPGLSKDGNGLCPASIRIGGGRLSGWNARSTGASNATIFAVEIGMI